MIEVSSNYWRFPTALEVRHEYAEAARQWFSESGLKYNDDYLAGMGFRSYMSQNSTIYSFRHRHHALMFKLALQGM